VPHRLYGHVDAAENYSVGRWCQDAARCWTRPARGRRADPGRRHRALLQGADPGAFGGAADAADIRAAVRARCDAEGARRCTPSLPAAIRAMAERLKPGDRMRIARALEVLEATGRSLRIGTATACRRSSTRRRSEDFPGRGPRRA
jgi:tRNA dimethylallyltransferase